MQAQSVSMNKEPSGSLGRPAASPKAATRIGVLNNLCAGQNTAGVSRLLSLLKGHPEIAHVETEDCDSLFAVLSAFADQEVGLLVVNGGDGTLQHVLTTILNGEVFERLPIVAPLRGGRTNMSATDIGCQRDPLKALAALVGAVRSGTLQDRIVDRAVLRVQIGPESPVQYGMFCGFGVISRAVELVHRAFPPGRHSRGVLGAGLITSVLVARGVMHSTTGLLTPDRMRIRLDGEQIAHDQFLLVIATTLGRLFLRMRPFWGREPAPVRVTTIARSPYRAVISAIGMLRGRPGRHVRPEGGYTSRNVHRAELHIDCGVCIDGELFPTRRDRIVQIEADRRVRFVRA